MSEQAQIVAEVLGGRAQLLVLTLERQGPLSLKAWQAAMAPPTPSELARLSPLIAVTTTGGVQVVQLTVLGRAVATRLAS